MRVQDNVPKCHVGEGGGLKSVEKCHVSFEWPVVQGVRVSTALLSHQPLVLTQHSKLYFFSFHIFNHNHFFRVHIWLQIKTLIFEKNMKKILTYLLCCYLFLLPNFIPLPSSISVTSYTAAHMQEFPYQVQGILTYYVPCQEYRQHLILKNSK